MGFKKLIVELSSEEFVFLPWEKTLFCIFHEYEFYLVDICEYWNL